MVDIMQSVSVVEAERRRESQWEGKDQRHKAFKTAQNPNPVIVAIFRNSFVVFWYIQI